MPLCEALDCAMSRGGKSWSRYCERHCRRNERTGDPLGRPVKRRDLRPWVTLVNDTLSVNIGHAGIEQACELVAHRLSMAKARKPVRALHPRYRADNIFASLRERGVRPYDVVAVVCAVYVMREFEPKRFPSDRHHRHQVAKAVYDLAPYVRPDNGRSGGAELTVGLREQLSHELVEAIGVVALTLAQHLAKHWPTTREPEPLEAPPARIALPLAPFITPIPRA